MVRCSSVRKQNRALKKHNKWMKHCAVHPLFAHCSMFWHAQWAIHNSYGQSEYFEPLVVRILVSESLSCLNFHSPWKLLLYRLFACCCHLTCTFQSSLRCHIKHMWCSPVSSAFFVIFKQPYIHYRRDGDLPSLAWTKGHLAQHA